METVILKPLYHRDEECVGIYFERNAETQLLVQNCGGKWSKTKVCWYVEMNEQNYLKLIKALSGNALLETRELDIFISKRKNEHLQVLPKKATKSNSPEKKLAVKSNKISNNESQGNISEENTQALQQYKQLLILKSYSSSTIRTYTNEFVQFLKAINPVGLKKNRS